ncbi:MAG: UvrD-helicase domain-containing protein [Proteobacteria bacterium]|nr:UvrD-helicase domain-containing protein [Pseudomonadota bacterium]
MNESASNYLNALNIQQKEAILHSEGPLLILAGAGSGKTKVLTTRVAQLIKDKKCFGNQILCVTFTNKAANEMRERVLKLTNNKSNSIPWLGTFHSISNKILRKHAEAVGLKPSFTILDTLDQLKLIKNILAAENIDIKKNPPKLIAYLIDHWKNKALLPANVKINSSDYSKINALKIYKIYQERLRLMNCVDFGDLILHCVTIFKNFKEIQESFKKNFKYILVDEYQDTNYVQNLWLNLITNDSKNICVVGDDDQSIYSWRGAEVKNILEFEKNFTNTKIVKLEQNYRSTKNIINTASSLISNNDDRLGKKIWSDLKDGDKVRVNSFSDGRDEATGISDIIEKELIKYFSLNDIAILVRAAFQTREFEERFIKIGLPYRVIGGMKFYERAEIKDALCYLRLIQQKNDDLAFERIINNPKRSIGDSTLKKLHDLSRTRNKNLFETADEILNEDELKPKTKESLKQFIKLVKTWTKLSEQLDHVQLLERVLDESGYTQMLINEKSPEAEARLENLKELRASMKNYSNLVEFLENISLQTSIDEEWEGEKINLMTIHAAKGLEFNCVFLPGWEEGLFPHQKSIEEKGDQAVQEERRLAYVALTRAKQRLFISFANNRKYYGNNNSNDWMPSMPSRFIDELDKQYLEINETAKDNDQDFEFSQDFNFMEGKKSPGWKRYLQEKEKIKTINYTNNLTNFKIGQGVEHETFGKGKIIHIDGNKLLINFKDSGEKKVIDKYLKQFDHE